MVLPAMGCSPRSSPSSRGRPIFGYKAIAFSTIGIAFASMLSGRPHVHGGDAGAAPVVVHGHLAHVAVPTAIRSSTGSRTLWRAASGSRRRSSSARLHRGSSRGRALRDHLAAYPVDYAVHARTSSVAPSTTCWSGGTVSASCRDVLRVPKSPAGCTTKSWASCISLSRGLQRGFLPQHMLGLWACRGGLHIRPGAAFEWYNLISRVGSFSWRSRC